MHFFYLFFFFIKLIFKILFTTPDNDDLKKFNKISIASISKS